MKHMLRWICPVLFLSVCATVIWFLHLFTVENDSMQEINWQTAVKIESDGTQTPISTNEFSNSTDYSGTYHFTGILPEGLSSGYLLFEISGANLSLSLNGTEIYHSSAVTLDGTYAMSQANIPLPEGASGEVVMICEIIDGESIMFPPFIRFIPDGLKDTQTFAIANRTAFPTGAAALAFVLIFGIFLLSITLHQIDFSLIPLLIAAAGLTVFRIAQGEGYYFLPQPVTTLLSHPWIGFLTFLVFFVYLAMNRRHDFWRQFVIAFAWSAGVLLLCYLISLSQKGSLSFYINDSISSLWQHGIYDGLLYWLTWWLTIVCGFISAYGVARSFSQQRIESQRIATKHQLLLGSYHSLEQRMRQSNVLHHEFNHNLTALNSLYQKGDLEGLKALLDKLTAKANMQAQTRFTDNFTINAILQDAAMRAAQIDTKLDAQIQVPKDLNIPEQDLCSLLMNMMDNALEACAKVNQTEKRQIHIRMIIRQGFLAIRCENSYEGKILKNKDNTFQSTKDDPVSHGIGLRLMSAIAEKYHSLINVMYTNDGSFIVQTALQIPENPET
ncbi:hypothetical protein NDGK_00279 [Clostridiales bacterium CHKCI001]|nr:hypothetical protein NDGK_00279 [Clostridiales bacterium CHKCI001]